VVACSAPAVTTIHGFALTSTKTARVSPRTFLLPVLTQQQKQQQFQYPYNSRHFSFSSDSKNNGTVANELPVRNFTDMETTTTTTTITPDHGKAFSTPFSPDDVNTSSWKDPSGAGDHIADLSKTSVVPPLPETLDASGLLSLDPEVVEIVEVPPTINNKTYSSNEQPQNMNAILQGLPFVSMFRGSANYIANHRSTLAIYHIPGGLLDLPDPSVFRDLMNDIALTWLLGMKIVLVVGCRHQVEKRIPSKERVRFFGIPVTDAETLRVVKEEAGYVRFEVERQLARSLRMQGGSDYGGGNKRYDHVDGNVVSGNFYSAQPFGILDGIDYKYTGFVRKVEVDKIKQLHQSRDICLLTTLGVSPSGEVFNVNSEALAATVAGTMDASKVIYFTEQEMELRHKIHGNKIQNLRFSDARHLLQYNDVQIHKRGFVTVGAGTKTNSTSTTASAVEGETPESDMLIKIGWATTALEQGVKRAHILSPKSGAVLQELYTRDGSGVLLSRDLYEGIRRATVNDVSNIYDLILPLIQAGTLVDRPKAVLEKDIDSYYAFTRDNHIVACGQLKIFEGAQGKRYAEIGCLVVNQEYRARGRGDAMLGYLERLCFLNGANTVFVLSTQTMEWFVERGFNQVTVEELPPSRQATYNRKRASKIYMKEIKSSRDLDQNELWWNR